MKYAAGIIAAVLAIFIGWSVFSSKSNDTSINTPEQNTSNTVSAVASFYPLAFALEQIGGEAIEVINIGGNQDPHDFRPSARDIQTMFDADLVAINGAGLEPWGEDIESQLENTQTSLFVASEVVDLRESEDEHDEHGEEEHGEDDHDAEHHDEDHEGEHHEDDKHEDGEDHEHNHGAFDPHVWLDPVLFAEIAEALRDELVTLDPSNKSLYTQNTDTLLEKLEVLDSQYEQQLARCELDEVITSHDAFGYVGDRYGFEIHAIAGISTQSTPSARALAELREEAEEGIGAILLENNSIAAFGETLARETGLKTLSIDPAVSASGGDDYIGIMNANLAAFAEALQCTNG